VFDASLATYYRATKYNKLCVTLSPRTQECIYKDANSAFTEKTSFTPISGVCLFFTNKYTLLISVKLKEKQKSHEFCHKSVSSEISDLGNFWRCAMCACTE